jgi:hypothetical protein
MMIAPAEKSEACLLGRIFGGSIIIDGDDNFMFITYQDFGDRNTPINAREGFLRCHETIKHTPDKCVTQ